MADSLDDFFAKKDKSKKKKFATSDQSSKKVEDGGRNPVEKNTGTKKEKEKTNSNTSGNSTSLQYQEQAEEEWGEVEEKEIDYTGLKIQNLQISELRDEEYEREKNEEYSEEGDQYGQRDGSGPWNKNSSSSTGAPLPDSQPVQERQPQQTQPKDVDAKPSAYCPPAMKRAALGGGGGGSGSGGGGGGGRSRYNRTAPEINSELHFPSLSAGAEASAGSKKKGDRLADSERGFESVKRGSRTSEDTVNLGPHLDLGNKFDALSQNEAS